jgi:hypothetical protein
MAGNDETLVEDEKPASADDPISGYPDIQISTS